MKTRPSTARLANYYGYGVKKEVKGMYSGKF